MLIDVVRACVKKRILHFIGTVIAFLPSLFAQSQLGQVAQKRYTARPYRKHRLLPLRRLRFLSAARSAPIKPEAQGIAQP